MKRMEIFAYPSRFDDLAMLYPSLVSPEEKKIDRYIKGLTLPIHEMAASLRPTTYNHAKKLVISLTRSLVRQE